MILLQPYTPRRYDPDSIRDLEDGSDPLHRAQDVERQTYLHRRESIILKHRMYQLHDCG